MVNSWLLLKEQNEKHALSKNLSAQDPLLGADCGWVEQMQPFIKEFSKEGETVLDIYAGWGSTLVAALLEGRNALGIEIEKARLEAAGYRLKAYAKPGLEARLIEGDSRFVELMPESVDLILTSVPYYRTESFNSNSAQIYNESDFSAYLNCMEASFLNTARALKPNGYLLAMAQNLHFHDRGFVPLAWELASRLAKHFRLEDERIICYEKAAIAAGKKATTNRAHEYVLVASIK